jgi:hypothetical protein
VLTNEGGCDTSGVREVGVWPKVLIWRLYIRPKVRNMHVGGGA